MSNYLNHIKGLYKLDYERRTKVCSICNCSFCDVSARNLGTTCSQVCALVMMSRTRRKNGTYVMSEEQKVKLRKSVKKTYKERDVFGPELRKQFSETMKKSWKEGKITSENHWTQQYDREDRLKILSRGKSGKREDLKDQYFRSTWEANFARILNLQDITWEYEHKIYKLKTISYTPDFWLPVEQRYVELKGWMNERSQRQIDEFRELYPNIELEVIEREQYEKLKLQFKSRLPLWEN